MTDKAIKFHNALKLSVIGFFITGFGVALGFAGHHFNSQAMVIIGYSGAAIGILGSLLSAALAFFQLIGMKSSDQDIPRDKEPRE